MRLVRAASGHNVCEIIDGSSSLACFLTDKKFHGARARGRPSPLVVVGMQSALLGCSPRQRSAQLSASARPSPSDARAIDVPFNFLALARDREREREKLGLGSIMHASQSRSRSCSFSLPPPPLAVLWLWWVWLWSSTGDDGWLLAWRPGRLLPHQMTKTYARAAGHWTGQPR